MRKVSEALSENGIPHDQIQGTAKAKSAILEKFQDVKSASSTKVLLLSLADESASGANLTTANHAIFISPLLTDTQQKYNAYETQAIGRVRRYGQLKKVHIWRFI